MKNLSLYDESYMYMNQGKSIIIRVEATLDSTVDGDRLREALSESLNFYPRFRTRACVDAAGHMQLLDNDGPLPVFPEDGSVRYLGSDDTNGYLFSMTYKEDYIKFTHFHALGDGAVTIALMNHLLIVYLRLMGRNIDDEGMLPVALDQTAYDELDECARQYISEHNIALPEEDEVREPNYIENSEQPYFKTPGYMARKLTLPYKELLDLAKRANVSPTAIMHDVLSQAFMDCRDTEGMPLRFVFAVNMRKTFNSNSQHNFSTDATVMYPASVAVMDARARYDYITEQMKLQMQEERLLKGILDNGATVEMMKQYFRLDQYQVIEAVTEKGQKDKLATFYLSSMGRAPIAKDVMATIRDMWLYGCPVRPLTDFYGAIYGDTYHLIITDNYVDQSILDRIGEILRDNGIQVDLEEAREITPDLVDPARFMHIQ